MKIRSFRILVGSIVLVAHFLATAIMVGYSLAYHVDGSQLIGNVVAVTPIAALYATTYFFYITANPNELASEEGQFLGKASVFTQIGVVLLFSLVLVLSPLYFFHLGNIKDASVFVGGIETVFGAFIARVFGLLFPSEILGKTQPPGFGDQKRTVASDKPVDQN